MRFSLVVATVDREDPLDRLFRSLEQQTWGDFEVILIDQNEDDRLVPLVERFRSIEIKHLRGGRGLSRARNVGLPHCTGEVVGFPDDDCWYGPGLLESVASALTDPELDGITGRCEDVDGSESSGHRLLDQRRKVSKLTAFRQGSSNSIFLRRRVVQSVGDFDEELGVGASTPWGAGEETDYLLRALSLGFNLVYDPSIVVGHERKARNHTTSDARRARSYGMGLGRVWRKHRFPLWYVAYEGLRSLGGSLLDRIHGDHAQARFHLAAFQGKVSGWWSKVQPVDP